MYRIIGSDQRLYGPVSAEVIRQWIAEGRVNASTVVQTEGSLEWKPLSAFPEFAPGGTPPVQPAQAQTQYQSQAQPIAVYPVAPPEANVSATLGFIFGLLSFFCCCSYLFGVPGLVLSIVGLNRANRIPYAEGKNLAIAGIILSVLGLTAGLSVPIISVFTHPHGNWNFHW